MKKKLSFSFSVLVVLAAVVTVVSAGGLHRKPTIEMGADQLVAQQRTDSGWDGTWYWYVGSTYNATNLTGVTALGLLEAYRDRYDPVYLTAAESAAHFIQAHLGAGATGTQYHIRTTAPDIVFLHRMKELTGDVEYANRATLEWNNITATFTTAGDLDALFRTINRRSAWDVAFFLEAAHMSGDMTWANDAAAILADTGDTFYYGTDTFWYALNVAGALRALVGCGYTGLYSDEVSDLRDRLIGVIGTNGVDGWIQDTAYAILALNTVGGAVQEYANELGRWLTDRQEADGGWLEGGDEYPEINGEAVRALASTNGTTVTLDGFEPGKANSSYWIKPGGGDKAVPFND